jgi:hypothetical protein
MLDLFEVLLCSSIKFSRTFVAVIWVLIVEGTVLVRNGADDTATLGTITKFKIWQLCT